MSLNAFNPANPRVAAQDGLIDAQFKSLKVSQVEVDQRVPEGCLYSLVPQNPL